MPFSADSTFTSSEIEIVQNLLGSKNASLEDIKEVISHPQALGQCGEYIHRHGFKVTESVNTAVAAMEVAGSGRTDIAAIGSELAAEKHGLKILDSHINESGGNTTRFAVFSKLEKLPSRTTTILSWFSPCETRRAPWARP